MNQNIDIALFTTPTGTRIEARSNQATNASMAWNLQGAEQLSIDIPLPLTDAFRLTDMPGTFYTQANIGAAVLWEGRLENPTITDQGSSFEALGYSRALQDIPYTALWSDTLYERWKETTPADIASRDPAQWVIDVDQRLYIAPQKGETFSNAGKYGSITYETPAQPSPATGRLINGISYNYEFLAPVTWRVELIAWSRAWTGPALLWGINATGAVLSGVVNITFTAVDRLEFVMYYNAGVGAVYGGETGNAYISIASIRVVTSTTNRVNTTFTANRAAGAGVTATVGSTANMYAGQILQIDQQTATAERVTVTSVTNSTQFVSTFANNHVIGGTVQAHVVYADEVVADVVSLVNAANSTQLSSSTALIQSPGRDLPDVIYDDTYGADVLSDLALRGDTQTSPRRWVWSVEIGRILRFVPLGYGGKTWYVDAADLTVQLSRENLQNDAYAVYEDAAGNTLRSAVNPSVNSVLRYGLTRRQAVSVNTSNAQQAQAAQNTAITIGALPTPKVQVNFTAVFDASGSRWPLYLIRPGDTIFIRNLPPTLSTTVDQIRSYVVARVEYRVDDDTIGVEPLDPLPTLEAALSG